MGNKPIIKLVEDNKAKNKTYSVLLGNYKIAMEQGYYGEAELIVYAYMEDQLKAFIYYSDGLDARNSRAVNANVEGLLKGKKQIDNISDKISVVFLLFKAAESADSEYAAFLKQIYRVTVDVGKVKRTLNKIKKWCNYRNEIVHSMFHKDIDELRNGYKSHVEEGFLMARFLDDQVKRLRKA